MSWEPKVSIIITTFNRADLLRNVIEGSINQDYGNLEIVISDNASTDNTQEVVIGYRRICPKIRYFRNSTNIGAVNNHGKALKEYATGDWAVFISDDDFIEDPSFVSGSLELIDKYGNDRISFLQTAVNVLYHESGIKKSVYPDISHDIEVINGRDYFVHYFEYKFFSFTTTIFNRKDALRFDIFNDKHNGTDVELLLLMSFEKQVILSKKVSGTYRVHESQAFAKSGLVNLLKIFSTYENVFLYSGKYIENKKISILWLLKARRNFFKDVKTSIRMRSKVMSKNTEKSNAANKIVRLKIIRDSNKILSILYSAIALSIRMIFSISKFLFLCSFDLNQP
ncbi:glycosyltransferase family 2 protein [bacterium]|nr:glycosyltransferase family 2 protein [bacterium]